MTEIAKTLIKESVYRRSRREGRNTTTEEDENGTNREKVELSRSGIWDKVIRKRSFNLQCGGTGKKEKHEKKRGSRLGLKEKSALKRSKQVS